MCHTNFQSVELPYIHNLLPIPCNQTIMELPPTYDCEVCFANPHRLNPHQALIRCQHCQRTAHRFCYNPTLAHPTFTCDACNVKYYGNCLVCNNSGLLKKFSNGFAHPLCLLFHPAIVVSDFQTLAFASAETLRPGKKLKCSYCENSTGSVLRCCSKKCPMNCHLYCAVKSYQVYEGKGWRVCLQPLDSEKSLKEVIENLLLRSLRHNNKFISGQLGIKKSLKTVEAPVMLYCEAHAATIVECSCREFNEFKLDWLYCDGCCRWIHWDCVTVTPQERQRIEASDEGYYCKECLQWQNWLWDNSLSVPQLLPKLHIYDYVYINRQIEEIGPDASSKLIELAQRIPLLPGLGYGKAFLKNELVKKLRHKINLAHLKEVLLSNNHLAKAFFQHKDQLEIIQWIVAEDFLGSHQQKHLPHPLEESLDSQYVQEMLTALEKYEKTYFAGKNGLLNNNMKCSQENASIKREKSTRTSRNSSVRDRSKTPPKPKLKIQHQVVPKKEETSIEEINGYLQTQLERFKNSAQKTIDLVQYFEQLFKVIKKSEFVAFLNDQPKNFFITALLQQTPRHAALYASFVVKMESTYRQIITLKDQDRANPNPYGYKHLKEALLYWSRLKEQINQIEQTLQLKQHLSEYCTNLELMGNLNVELLQRECQDSKTSLDETVDSEKIIWRMRLKDVERVRLKKQAKNQVFPLEVLSSVLRQLKGIKFNIQSKEVIAMELQLLKNQGSKMQHLAYFFNQYLSLFSLTQNLLAQLKIAHESVPLCFFQLLSRYFSFNRFPKDQKELDSAITFLERVKKVRSNLFSREVQLVIVSLVKVVVQYFEGATFTREEELAVVTYWSTLLKLPLSSELDKLIKLDQTLCQKYFFQQLCFERPQEIIRLKQKIETDLLKFKELNLTFRIKKMTLLLEWIYLYHSILQKIPLSYILGHSVWEEAQGKRRPKLQEIIALDNKMTILCFPQCKFRQKFRELSNIGKQLKTKFGHIMSLSNWEFLFQNTKLDWNNKVELSEVTEFINLANRLPICLQVQTIQCEIIAQKFTRNQQKAGKLLQELESLSSDYLDKSMLATIKQILNHYGATPIRGQYTEKLLLLLENKQNPNKIQEKAQKMYHAILSTPEYFTYGTVCWLMNYMNTEYQGKLDNAKVVSNLKQSIAIIDDCLEEFKDLLEKFKSEKQAANDYELKRVQLLTKKYKNSSIKHLTFMKLCSQYALYSKITMLQANRGQNSLLLLPLTQTTQLHNIISSLHPFFCTSKISILIQPFDDFPRPTI